MRLSTPSLIAMAVLLGLASPGAHAAGSTDACVGYITGPNPVSIRTPGTWCMRADAYIDYDHEGIAVMASDVTIDCKGFTIVAVNPDMAIISSGIMGMYPNLTVRNCRIRDYRSGIDTSWLGPADEALIEDNVIENGSLDLGGDGVIARRNVVRNGAIRTKGDIDILDNTVVNPLAFPAIYASGSTGSIRGNRITAAQGIDVYRGAPKIRDNELTGTGTGIGIECEDPSAAVLKDNLITGYATPMTGCAEAGGNFTSP